MRIGSLFSGIGGLELGLEMAGVGHTVWQVELDGFCRRVLSRHWPEAERFDDVRFVGRSELRDVDVICGGFPCQDVSSAGKRAGMSGAKSGLWFEYLRIVEELRPRFVVVENVASGKRAWLPTVRRGLHLLGYRSTAVALSAYDVGAPHLRRRIFVIAYANGDAVRIQPGRSGRKDGQRAHVPFYDGKEEPLAYAASERKREQANEAEPVAACRNARPEPRGGSWWETEPEVGRVADGVPDRMARLKALGNAVVPQCAKVIGRVLLEVA